MIFKNIGAGLQCELDFLTEKASESPAELAALALQQHNEVVRRYRNCAPHHESFEQVESDATQLMFEL